jgi:hypothetical protein
LSRDEGLVEVYFARNSMEAQVIKSLLEGFAIPCFLKSDAAPSVHIFTMDGMAEVRILVPASRADEAKELILSSPPEDDVGEGDSSLE